MNKVFIWCYMALAFSPVLFAQVDFKATVSKNTLGINERLRVEFSMNKDGDNFAPPSFDGFDFMEPFIIRSGFLARMEALPTDYQIWHEGRQREDKRRWKLNQIFHQQKWP